MSPACLLDNPIVSRPSNLILGSRIETKYKVSVDLQINVCLG
jgi:hypothetical protein